MKTAHTVVALVMVISLNGHAGTLVVPGDANIFEAGRAETPADGWTHGSNTDSVHRSWNDPP